MFFLLKSNIYYIARMFHIFFYNDSVFDRIKKEPCFWLLFICALDPFLDQVLVRESAFRGKAGLYIENLYVKPQFRGHGIGKAMLSHLAKIAVERDFTSMDWVCPDRSEPNLSGISGNDFSHVLKANATNDLTTYRLSGEAVEAKNMMHSPKKCVGYIVTIDGVTLYCSGDTSKTEQMKSFTARAIDYALLPLDGIFNMSLKEGAECARLICAKHNIPIHLKPGALFDRKKADKWDAPNKLIIEPGQEIEL